MNAPVIDGKRRWIHEKPSTTFRGAWIAVLLALLSGRVAGQLVPPRLWTFVASGPADAIVPAATPDGGVVVVVPNRLSEPGVQPVPSRIQKVTGSGELAWQHDLTWDGIGWPVALEDGAVLLAEGTPQFGAGRLHCYAPDGSVRWSLDPGGSPVISPILDATGDLWIAVTEPDTNLSHALLRLSPTGEVHLRRSLGAWVHGPGAVLADGQLILPVGGHVVSLGPDGGVRWAAAGGLNATRAPALSRDGTLVVTSANGWLLVINPDGSIQREHWPGLEMMAPLVGADGTIYALRSDGRIEVRDRLGELIRQIDAPAFPEYSRAQIAPALAAGGWVWLPLRNGEIAAYSAQGVQVASWSSPDFVLAGGAPLLRSDGSLVVGFRDGRVLALGQAGAPMPEAWPLLGGNPARNARQASVTPPGAPASLAVAWTNEAAHVTWELPPGLVTCEVWRGLTSDLTQAVRLAAFLVSNEWTDPDVVGGYEYWYWVRARNAAGYGPYHEPVAFQRALPGPGEHVARFHIADASLSAPAEGPDGTLYVGDAKGGLTALALDGTRRWRFATGTEEPVGTPLVEAEGRLYFTATSSGLYGLASDGTLLWKLPYQQYFRSPPVSPALDSQGQLLVTGLQGSEQWALRLSRAGEVIQATWLGTYLVRLSSPVLAGDDSSWRATETSIGRRDREGNALWGTGAYGHDRAWPLALDLGGEVLSGGTGPVAGLSRFASDGRLLWTVGTNDVTGGAVVDADGVAYFGDQAGEFRAVDRAGELRWETPVDAPVSCMPALGEPDLVYVGTEAGRLLALECTDGEERWRLELGARPVGGLVVLGAGELAVSTEDGVLHRIRVGGGVPPDALWPMLGRNAAHHGRLPAPLPPLLAPAPVTATDAVTNTDVVVTWEPVPGAARYELFRAPIEDVTAAVPLVTNLTDTTTFTDFFVPANQPHWYWVRATSADGPGPWSEPARGSQGTRLWRVVLRGGLTGPPAVAADGTAYALIRQTADTRATVVALAAATGAELWRRSVGASNFTVPSGRLHAPVLAEDGRLFVAGRQALACFSAQGDLLWERPAPTNAPTGPMALTRSGLLVHPSDSVTIARRASDGEVLWKAAGGWGYEPGPVIAHDGTIWIARQEEGTLALRPNGTVRFQVPVNAGLPPALSRSGHLLIADTTRLVHVVRPDGTLATGDPPWRAASPGLASAVDQFSFILSGPLPELVLVNHDAEELSRIPVGQPTFPGFPRPDAVVAGGDGTWYLMRAPVQVTVQDAAGNLRAVWPLKPPTANLGAVLGEDGVFYFAESGCLVAFRGFGPPAPDAWAMLRKDRRNSASWEEELAPPALPSGFAVEPTHSLNTVELRWQQPDSLTLIELWRSDTTDFGSARLLLGPVVTQTSHIDRDRTPGSSAYYWLRALDLAGNEVGRIGALASTTASGASVAWTAPLSWSGGRLSLAEDGTLYHLLDTLTAYRPDGTVRWQQGDVSGAPGSQPVVAADGTILAWHGMRLFAVNPGGDVRWQRLVHRLQSDAAELAVSESGLVVAAGRFGLLALDLEGEHLWSVWDEPFTGVALGADNTVYATTRTSRQLQCFAPDGQLRWTAPGAGVFERGLSLDGTGALLAPGNDSRLRWFNPLGELTAELALAGDPGEAVFSLAGLGVPQVRSGLYPDWLALLDAGGVLQTNVSLDCGALTAAADGTWLTSARARLVALESNGAIRWSYDLPPNFPTLSPTLLSPTGRIYFAVGATLYALDSDLRPAPTGWSTTRANHRRTGQWLLPPPRARFNGIARLPDGRLELQILAPPGTTNELQHSTDCRVWVPVESFPGTGEGTRLGVATPDAVPRGFFRVRSSVAP